MQNTRTSPPARQQFTTVPNISFLSQGLDMLTFDLSCHGEAPCPGPGLTYDYRESRDVIAAYKFLQDRYAAVYVMGSSMGATSVLTALPELQGVAGVIVENPMCSFEQLIKDAPEAQSMPSVMSSALIKLTMWRGGFDISRTPALSLRSVNSVPVLSIHSRADAIIPYGQTQKLADLYKGPETVWLTAQGKHSEVWNSNKAEYEQKVAAFLDALQ